MWMRVSPESTNATIKPLHVATWMGVTFAFVKKDTRPLRISHSIDAKVKRPFIHDIMIDD